MKKKSVLKPILGLAIAGGLLVPTVADVKAASFNPTLVEKLERKEYNVSYEEDGYVYKGIADNMFQTTHNSPGTLIAVFKRNSTQGAYSYFKHLFENPKNRYIYYFQHSPTPAEPPYPVITPSKSEYERYDNVNLDSFDKFHIRKSLYIENPTKENKYYLVAYQPSRENAYNEEIRFYEGVNYMLLPENDLTHILNTYTPAQSKSIAGKSIAIPKDTEPYREPIARLIAKQDIPLLKKESNGSYTAVKMLDKGGFYRIYGVEGNLYNVGGDYYVPRNDALMSHFIGRLQVNKSVPMYNPSGQIHRYLTAGEAVRVFDYDNGKYDVGGGYYVLDSTKIQYFVGAITANQNVSVFSTDGKVAYTLKKGQRVFIERLEGNKAYIDGDTYIVHDKSKTTYSKS
ncbi:hypothetical protein [Metabacillus endolithicus]|uniref:Uncharacterized protein n=1 Tax=Metabacillus endolithicus TaxID=1535204 RepID=A0ABW5C408_9BACI